MLLVFLILALTQPINDIVVGQWYSHVLGQRWASLVRQSDVNASPEWKDHTSDPPLTAPQAILIATRQLEKLLPNADEWSLVGIRLEQIARPSTWVYVIEFREPPSGPLGGPTSRLGIVVLMSGNAIEPIHAPVP
jgi:hypothetical protein